VRLISALPPAFHRQHRTGQHSTTQHWTGEDRQVITVDGQQSSSKILEAYLPQTRHSASCKCYRTLRSENHYDSLSILTSYHICPSSLGCKAGLLPPGCSRTSQQRLRYSVLFLTDPRNSHLCLRITEMHLSVRLHYVLILSHQLPSSPHPLLLISSVEV
jgi:hypothetical protein